jgi:predicted DNA binding protein
VIRVYNPTTPDAGPWYGLTTAQREALVLAVESGYYDIPRTCTTVEVAEELGISDQAVTERLRRAIVNLVDNSLLVAEEDMQDREASSSP